MAAVVCSSCNRVGSRWRTRVTNVPASSVTISSDVAMPAALAATRPVRRMGSLPPLSSSPLAVCAVPRSPPRTPAPHRTSRVRSRSVSGSGGCAAAEASGPFGIAIPRPQRRERRPKSAGSRGNCARSSRSARSSTRHLHASMTPEAVPQPGEACRTPHRALSYDETVAAAGIPAVRISPSCCARPQSSVFCQSSASIRSAKRKMSMPVAAIRACFRPHRPDRRSGRETGAARCRRCGARRWRRVGGWPHPRSEAWQWR